LYVKAGTAAEDVDEGWSWANAPPESNKVVSNVNRFIFKEKNGCQTRTRGGKAYALDVQITWLLSNPFKAARLAADGREKTANGSLRKCSLISSSAISHLQRYIDEEGHG
jgi:hypothetical protein